MNFEVFLSERTEYHPSDIYITHRGLMSEIVAGWDIYMLNEADGDQQGTSQTQQTPQQKPKSITGSHTKDTLIGMFQKLIEIIKNLSQKFINVAQKLTRQNRQWLAKIRDDQAFPESTSDSFEFEMVPYWEATQRVLSFRIPEFQETSSQFIDDLKDPDSFKEKYLKSLMIKDKSGKLTFDPKSYFRGPKSNSIDRQAFIANYGKMMDFLDNYNELIKPIVMRNNTLIDLLQKGINKVKSTLFRESAMNESAIDGYLTFSDWISGSMNMNEAAILLEQDGPTTSDEAHKTSGDNRENGKDPDKESKDIITARATYNKIIYQVNAARMMIMEKAYDAYARCIASAYASSKKSDKQDSGSEDGKNK